MNPIRKEKVRNDHRSISREGAATSRTTRKIARSSTLSATNFYAYNAGMPTLEQPETSALRQVVVNRAT